MFSDFFDTTEAEMERPKSTKRIRKTKKLLVKMVERKAISNEDSSCNDTEQAISGTFCSYSLLSFNESN